MASLSDPMGERATCAGRKSDGIASTLDRPPPGSLIAGVKCLFVGASAGARVHFAVWLFGRRVLASEGGSAEVVHALTVAITRAGISGDGLMRAMRPGGDAPLKRGRAVVPACERRRRQRRSRTRYDRQHPACPTDLLTAHRGRAPRPCPMKALHEGPGVVWTVFAVRD